MRTMLSVLLCLALLFVVSCDPDGGSDQNPNQEKIKSLLDELKVADDEVATYYQANTSYPTGYNRNETGGTITRTYTSYTNAHGVLIDGTDSITTPPPPQTGAMDMDFSGGTVGNLTRLRLNMTLPASGPRVVNSCYLNDTNVTGDAQDMYDNPPHP